MDPQKLLDLITLGLSAPGLYGQPGTLGGNPQSMAPRLPIHGPAQPPQQRLKITKIQVFGVAAGFFQQFLRFAHRVTIYSYTSTVNVSAIIIER